MFPFAISYLHRNPHGVLAAKRVFRQSDCEPEPVVIMPYVEPLEARQLAPAARDGLAPNEIQQGVVESRAEGVDETEKKGRK